MAPLSFPPPALIVLLSVMSVGWAFRPGTHSHMLHKHAVHASIVPLARAPTVMLLNAEAEASAEAEEEARTNAEAEAKAEAEPEDPELVALKVEIEEFEAKLKSARLAASDAKTKVDDSGQAGYSRLAALVDNYRRMTQGSRSQQEAFAQMRVLSSFVDIIGQFESAELAVPASNPEEESVHVGYQKLYGQLMEKFVQFGLQRFDAVTGEKFDFDRHEQAEEVDPTNDFPAGTVVEQLRDGLSTSSGTIRKALVVVAKGEVPAEAGDAEEETPAD